MTAVPCRSFDLVRNLSEEAQVCLMRHLHLNDKKKMIHEIPANLVYTTNFIFKKTSENRTIV